MAFDKIQRNRIYKHTELEQRDADKFRPLIESAFASELANYTGKRQSIKDERLRFASEQYANRVRVAKNMGVSPLNEDANIFSGAYPTMKNLFESVSVPGNIIGLGEVRNPMEGNKVPGGMWNGAYKPGSGDIPSYVFGLQTQIALHCIGFDLMPTIAVDTPKCVISYVDTVYGGGAFDSLENVPGYVEVSANVFKRSWIKEKELKRAVSKVVVANEDGTSAIEFLFVVGSTIKAALTMQVLSTGKIEGTTYTAENTKTVKEIIDTINEAATGKVYVAADGETYEEGEELTAVGIDYASATRTNIAEAASNNNSLGGMSRAQHEKGTVNTQKLNLIMMDKQLECNGIEIEADTTNIQIKDMAASGINAIAYLYSGVQNQLVQTLDEIILDHLYKLGATHAVNVYESQGVNYSLFIGKPANATKPFTEVDVKFENMLGEDLRERMGEIPNALVSAGYENQLTHADRLYSRILLLAEFIGYQNRIAPADFVVASGELCSCLKKHASFAVCPTATTLSSNPELAYTGTIFDSISVYNNPKIDFNDPRVLFGRRGNDTDPGAKFLGYDIASSRQTIAESTMAEKIRVWSRFAIADIGFYPELNYYTAVAINEYQWA